jgi:nucleoside-diphosphate-sugar epimerase
MALRVALTGATGFSGQYILPQILAAGHEVVALARKPEALSGKCKNVVVGHLGDEEALAKLVAGADVVIHNAGATAAKNRAEFFEINVEGTKRLFRAARAAKTRRFVFVSSITAREPDLSAYAASKAEAEKFLLPHDDEDCDVLVLRPPAIYGPGDKATLPLFKMLQARVAVLPGRKSSRFSLLHVSDFAKVVCDSVDVTAHAIFELDDQTLGYSWADLAAANAELTGQPQRVMHLPRGMAHAVAGLAETYARLRGVSGMTTREKMAEIYHNDWVAHGWLWPISKPVKLREGMAQTLKWYREHGWLPPEPRQTRSAS